MSLFFWVNEVRPIASSVCSRPRIGSEGAAELLRRESPAADRTTLFNFGFSCLLLIPNAGFWKKWDKNFRLRNFVPLWAASEGLWRVIDAFDTALYRF